MKHSFYIILINFISLGANGQIFLSGEYNERTTHVNGIKYPRYLKLNCDMSFITRDSVYIVYGKWNFKNEKLNLLIDSISDYKETRLSKRKVTYLIKDNRIFREPVSKKEYKDLVKKGRKYIPHSRTETFEEFKLREDSKYFEKLKSYDCK